MNRTVIILNIKIKLKTCNYIVIKQVKVSYASVQVPSLKLLAKAG